MTGCGVHRAALAAFAVFAWSTQSSGEALTYKPFREGTSELLRLQDFCVFRAGGYTYVAPMMKDFSGKGIPVARSKDLAGWEELGLAVSTRTEEDTSMVWAPHVVEADGEFLMFYTGVTQPAPGQWCQRILVASTRTPDSPSTWNRDRSVRFIVDGKEQSWFRPDHPGHVWSGDRWADCRDPMVLEHAGRWYLFYTGYDTSGGIVGVATAPHPKGPWTDRGAVLRVDAGIPESPFVLKAPDGTWVMTFNHAGGIPGGGSKTARAPVLIRRGSAPSFGDIRPLSETTGKPLTGWAHEFLTARGPRELTAAYLTGYWVNFHPARFRRETFGWTVTASE